MKTKGVWFILFLSIVSLFIFQSMWLNNTYHIKIKDVQKEINNLLSRSIDKEVKLRIEQNIPDVKMGLATSIPAEASLTEYIEFNDDEVAEAGIHQHILNYDGFPFKLASLDNIFINELKNANIILNYLLYFKDSTGIIIEQTGNLPQSKSENAFYSESRLIVDGKRVQAIVDITPSIVFQQMIGILIVSFIMFVIIMFCVFYQTKIIFDEYKLTQLRRDFSHALTHDMKTPLSTIDSILANFRSGILNNRPEMQEKHGKIAMDQTKNLLSLVNKILTIAQIEEGKYTLNRTLTDMQMMITELEERFSVWKKKQISIQTSVEIDENKEIYIDDGLIKNAISNLIENAIKYSGDSVTINIRCFISDDNLYIIVKDNGFGIAEKNMKIIFEKFERTSSVRKKGIVGFGVGLNYVKLAAEIHGGIVKIFSKEGDYSEFSIVLPLVEHNHTGNN